jgi:hypothetical protein
MEHWLIPNQLLITKQRAKRSLKTYKEALQNV